MGKDQTAKYLYFVIWDEATRMSEWKEVKEWIETLGVKGRRKMNGENWEEQEKM